VSEWDLEVLVPRRVLRVRDHAGARNGGAGEADGHVRIAGDDFAVAVAGMSLLPFPGDGGAAGVKSREEPSHALGEHVHVRKEPSILDYQIEGAVEVDHGVRIVRHCHRGGVNAR